MSPDVGDWVCLIGDVEAGLPAGRVLAVSEFAATVEWMEGDFPWAFDESPDGVTVELFADLHVLPADWQPSEVAS